MQDFSFQGKVYLGERDPATGKPLALTWVGDAPTCQVKLSTSTSPRTESYSGNRVQTGLLNKGVTGALSLTLNWFSSKNLTIGLYGTANTIATGTVTSEPLPAELQVGDTFALDFPNVSNLVITDSTATPKTLVKGTDYTEESLAAGLGTLLNVGTYTQPFKAAYSYAGGVDITMFTQLSPERYLLLDGINTVDESRVLLRLYRCKFNPAAQIDGINSDWGQIALDGAVLYDSINAADSNMGGFGKYQLPTGS
jgi:hypothetical protein